MRLRPHLHFLVPSSSQNILLETRIYQTNLHNDISGYSDSSTSTPTIWSNQSLPRTHRVVIASHPWGRLGGNMLFPVLSQFLVDANFEPERPVSGEVAQDVVPKASFGNLLSNHENPKTSAAIVTLNVRGVGHSQGSQPWLGAGEQDFAAVEMWAVEVFKPKEILRLGYSWGCISAVHAPMTHHTPLKSIMLVSPALSPLKLLWWYNPFRRTVRSILSNQPNSIDRKGEGASGTTVMLVYGTDDNFTGVNVFKAFTEELRDLPRFAAEEVADGGHFWSGEDGKQLEEIMRRWLE